MADDILNELATACVCGPLDADGACLPCCAHTEIVRLRAAGDKLAEAHIDDLCDCNQPECVTIREAHAAWQEARRG